MACTVADSFSALLLLPVGLGLVIAELAFHGWVDAYFFSTAGGVSATVEGLIGSITVLHPSCFHALMLSRTQIPSSGSGRASAKRHEYARRNQSLPFLNQSRKLLTFEQLLPEPVG